jgi:hypothetical protein
MLLKLYWENNQHLNIKPSNIIKNSRGDYILSEPGYISINANNIDNEVFRSP